MRRWIVTALIVFTVAPSITAGAQTTAAELLPPEARFGPGWDAIRTVPRAPGLPDAFQNAAYAIYAGPRGSRLVLNVFIVAPGMQAIRDSWEVANEYFESYRQTFDFDFDVGRETDLEEQPLPDGCANARRTYGLENAGFESFAVGLTLCAADPDVIVIALASSPIGQGAGYRASDEAVEAVLIDANPTPTAGD